MIAIAWTINNVPTNPNPAMGTYRANGPDNNTYYGWLMPITSSYSPNCANGCTIDVNFTKPIYLLITTGPAGRYAVNGRSYAAVSEGTYIYGRWTMNSNGNNVYQGSASENNSFIIVPPIIDPDVSCDFYLDNNTLDLGVVDISTASKASTSAVITATCNQDAYVELQLKDQHMDNMKGSGLDVLLYFDDNESSAIKTDWKIPSTREMKTTLNVKVKKVGTLVPGEYTQPGIIYIKYN